MSKNSSRVYPTGLILKIIEENERDHIGPTALAKKYGIKVCTVKYWLKDYRRNGYDAFCGNKKKGYRMVYDGKFKKKVMRYWEDNPKLSCYDVCKEFSIGRTTLRQWKVIYDEKGIDAFLRETRGAKRKMERQKAILSSKKTDSEKILELERQIEYLQAENEYLKKLNALTHKKGSLPIEKNVK